MHTTPTQEHMSIYLVNVPLAVIGVAIIVAPPLARMRHRTRRALHDGDATHQSDTSSQGATKEYDHAA